MVESIHEGYSVESTKPLVWCKDSQDSTRDWRVCQPSSGCKWWADPPVGGFIEPWSTGTLLKDPNCPSIWVSFEHVVFHLLQPNSIHFRENQDDPEDFKVVTHFQTNRSFLLLADPCGPASGWGSVGVPTVCTVLRLADWPEGGYSNSDKDKPEIGLRRGEVLIGGGKSWSVEFRF